MTRRSQPKPPEYHYPDGFKELCVDAYRYALEMDRAPERCRSRPCLRTGRCHFTMSDDQPGHCHAGLTGAVSLQAALIVGFCAREYGWTRSDDAQPEGGA